MGKMIEHIDLKTLKMFMKNAKDSEAYLVSVLLHFVPFPACLSG